MRVCKCHLSWPSSRHHWVTSTAFYSLRQLLCIILPSLKGGGIIHCLLMGSGKVLEEHVEVKALPWLFLENTICYIHDYCQEILAARNILLLVYIWLLYKDSHANLQLWHLVLYIIQVKSSTPNFSPFHFILGSNRTI